MSLSLASRETDLPLVMQSLKENGMTAIDASEDEMAKSHGKYLLGGTRVVEQERLFRFSFPERPGALGLFLDILPDNINGRH